MCPVSVALPTGLLVCPVFLTPSLYHPLNFTSTHPVCKWQMFTSASISKILPVSQVPDWLAASSQLNLTSQSNHSNFNIPELNPIPLLPSLRIPSVNQPRRADQMNHLSTQRLQKVGDSLIAIAAKEQPNDNTRIPVKRNVPNDYDTASKAPPIKKLKIVIITERFLPL